MNAVSEMKAAERIPCGAQHFADVDRLEVAAPAIINPFGDLLKMIAEVLDVREIIPQVSPIANRVLPHDGLELIVHDQAGNVTLRARSTEDCPRDHHLVVAESDECRIVGDLREIDLRSGGREARECIERSLAAGYQSGLSVRSLAGRQILRLGFFSKELATYTAQDAEVARLIAAYIAVAVSHDQLVEAERERVEARLRTEQVGNRPRSAALTTERHRGADVVGESAAWRKVLANASRVAPTDTTVFLQGESGTGKEVLARFIHRASPRKNGPFVAINCAGLPEQLFESELFGYERGAFTGANQSKPGQIELASSGVLFLDEVSEVSPTAQAKLLRFLQEREFQRLGGTRVIRTNVRVIAASNRDLRQAVGRGTFREDLFYRLQVFDLCLPALRDRPSDIPVLAEAFLRSLGRSMGRPSPHLTQAAAAKLLAHSWPGNVRELQNALERAAILSENGEIEPEHFSFAPEIRTETGTDLGAAERQTIQRVMQETDGNKAKAARRLGITRTQLYVRLRKYGLEVMPPLPSL